MKGIEDAVWNSAQNFRSRWNSRVEKIPVLLLDGTWPSLSILDLVVMPFISRKDLVAQEQMLLKQIASFTAIAISEAWNTFGASVQVRDGEKGVTLHVYNGPGSVSEAPVQLALESYLRKLLENPPQNLPIFRDFSRALPAGHGVISLTALGASTGLSPFIEGAWEEETTESFKDEIQSVVSHFAKQCVHHYERLFPNEMLGQVGEFYLDGLIFPPFSMDETLPGQNGVRGLFRALKELRVKREQVIPFAKNLVQNPDELISSVGLCFAAALLTELPDATLVSASEGKGRSVGLLRAAMVETRTEFGFLDDWLIAGAHTPQIALRFEIEKSLGFLPWIAMSSEILKERVKDPKINRLLESLVYFDMPSAIDAADTIILETPKNIEVRLQRVYLHILNGEFDLVDLALRSLLTEPGCEEEPRLYTYWGLNDLCLNKKEDALRHLEQAYALTPPFHPLRGAISNDFGWALLVNEQPERAIEIIDHSLDTNRAPLTSLLNKSFALRQLGRIEEAERVLDQCIKLAPLDRRVFLNALLTSR